MAAPVPQKPRVPGGSKWGGGTLEDPLGSGRRRGGVTVAGGFPGSAHLAATLSALGRARHSDGRDQGRVSPAREARPPEAAGSSLKLTCRRYRAAAASQSNAPSAALHRVVGPWRPRPASSPWSSNRGRCTSPLGAWPGERSEKGGARRARGGPSGAGALTALLRAGSRPGPSAAGRWLDRGATRTMPVTGKTFRRRRADSESEEDEQDSEEVRCVWSGVSTGQEKRSRLRDSSRARLPLHNIGRCEPVLLPLSADEEIEASATPKAAHWKRCPRDGQCI